MRKLTICMPAFERPHLIGEAIESCFRQRFRPIEIIVGDDSVSDEVERVAVSMQPPPGVELHYRRNPETLGQSRNVNSLIEQATGSHLMLLHDDDLLCDGGVDILASQLEAHPNATCLYGLQYIVEEDGTIVAESTSSWNQRDRRVPPWAGVQASPLRAALWHQVPNNGYLLDAQAAKASPLRSEELVGHAVDADFIIGIAKKAEAGSFVFVPEYVSKYRLTRNSIARSRAINTREDLFFDSVLADQELEREDDARDDLLRRIAVGAALDAAMAGRRMEALRIMGSRYYGAPWLSRWTGYRLMAVATPGVAEKIKQFFV
ncbi:glycosyltransferase [Aureimonas leprariae]|nr:glycosyltransferase [Aureimonas leprariae]